jgi:hypothetical protein
VRAVGDEVNEEIIFGLGEYSLIKWSFMPFHARIDKPARIPNSAKFVNH